MQHHQHEIVERSPLLAPDGTLLQTGWARQPLLDCNLEDTHFYRVAAAQRYRIKRWDYYGVTHPAGYFSATIADLGYAGQVFVYAVDFEKASYVEDTITIPLGRGVKLPRNSDTGRTSWSGRKARLLFDVSNGMRTLNLDWAGFGGQHLATDLRFAVPGGHESTVIVTPIGERRFYYNRKINCMPASGTIIIGGHAIDVSPETSLGTLDWGRGVWAYDSFWVWASASGFLADGRTVGLNFGFGFGNTSAATENTLLLNGRIHKLVEVEFDYDNADFMKPWQMRSDRVDLTFTPFLDRTAKTNLLLIRSEVHQMFGHYAGTIVDDAGDQIPVEGVVGWAEEHQARW